MDATAWSRLAITIALSAGIAGCELLPEQPGMGGYAMRELDIHDLRLSGDVGPVDDIGGEPEATQAVSCPGELMFSFVTEDGDQTVELDLILNQVIPEMHPGETYRVQSDDGRHRRPRASPHPQTDIGHVSRSAPRSSEKRNGRWRLPTPCPPVRRDRPRWPHA